MGLLILIFIRILPLLFYVFIIKIIVNFIRRASSRKYFNRDDISKCSNCRANITGNKCEYCRTTIKNKEFKISNIKRISE